MFSVHKMPKEFENVVINAYFEFMAEENLGREIKILSRLHCFRKAPFPKGFLSTLKGKGGIFKFLRFEEGTVMLVKS